jgi:hypothetical protein
MANTNNIELGPSTVVFSGTVGGLSYNALDLGAFTEDGVTLTITDDFVEVPTDQTGTAPAKIFLGGQSATVTTPLLEEAFDQIYTALVGSVSGTGNRIDFGRSAGYDVLANWSGQLTITPLDSSRPKWVLYKCVPGGQKSFNFNSSNPTVLNVEWRALPDTTKNDGKRLGYRVSQ